MGEPRTRRRVEPRDVWTVIWVVLVAALALLVLWEIRRILIWLLISVFFAAVLSPPVAWLAGRGMRRGLAVAVVTVGLFVGTSGVIFAFAQPLVRESVSFAQDLPQTVDRIRNAPVVRDLVRRLNIENRVETVSKDLPQRLVGLTGPLLSAFATIGQALIAGITIAVLTVFLLIYGPQFASNGLDFIGDPVRRARVERVGRDSLRAVSGWVAGNVITSIIAALVALGTFLVLGLPYGVLLALWVGVADLIPLAGATLGAVPAIIVAFLHSVPAGIVVTVFFILYQQFENHVLQPAVYSRTIKLNPFLVLVAVLIGVELLGFIGALLALPVAGVLQVVVADILEHRRARLGATTNEARLIAHEP